jgi:putative DNA methylase
MKEDFRLIEDYLPIEAISAEASREKSVRKGHISTLHLWWARRPLVACRAAVYGALVPAQRWVKDVSLKNPPECDERADKAKNGKKKGLNRKAAKEFVTKLCRYPKTNPTKAADVRLKRETETAISEAQRHILEAHAERLTDELAVSRENSCKPKWVEEFGFTGDNVSPDDILSGRAPRPRVLDMFAGGGAIPLEALRLGCESYALDLNPVAHIIQLCTLVYPQKYGRSDLTAHGMTGLKNEQGESTWGGLANEIRHWGKWVVDQVRLEIGDLYPPIPDPNVWEIPPTIEFDTENGGWSVKSAGTPKVGIDINSVINPLARTIFAELDDLEDDEVETDDVDSQLIPHGFLQPVAYLWTRTVRCKNPTCSATIPLLKQTWLCKKEPKRNRRGDLSPGRYAALKVIAEPNSRQVSFKVVDRESEDELGFDPTEFSKGGSATCAYCGTVADSDYVKEQGRSARIHQQLMAVACTRAGHSGKVYLGLDQLPENTLPNEESIIQRISKVQAKYGLSRLTEQIEINPRSMDIDKAGFMRWADIFTGRQQLAMMAAVGVVKSARKEIDKCSSNVDPLTTMLGASMGKFADFCSTLCMFNYTGGRGVKNSFPQQSLPMVWDFAETNPFNPAGASISSSFRAMAAVVDELSSSGSPAIVQRGSALSLPWDDATLDAVITDPPYYDNVSYSNLSDFFYVWLKRGLGEIHPEHFANQATPKKAEAIAAPYRTGGDRVKANSQYEEMMEQAFREAHRVLVPRGEIVVVYAHKTTLGWSTLVDALRRSGFSIVEAWPLDTERKGRVIAMDTAALASSIFLVGRKRELSSGVGNYEDDVQPELDQIVRERVETLWEMGIAGADLVIASVGAGLRAFTKYERVEYANGEEVPAEKFLAEVEGAVLDTMLGKLLGKSKTAVSAIDPSSRFYVLWRFVYKATTIDAGEAIVFTYAQHVELDGTNGLSSGRDSLVEKKKAKYRARDFSERGDNEKLGLPNDLGQPAPLIDGLHRVLWLMENSPNKLPDFLAEASLDRERLRILAQALVGAALSGKSEEDSEKLIGTTVAERSALGKLLANWKSLIENSMVSKGQRVDRARGQASLFE